MTFRSKTDWSLILKGCRREQNFSQRELAEKSGVSERTVQQYENAKLAEFSITKVERILDTLGYDLDAIFRNERVAPIKFVSAKDIRKEDA